MAQAEKKDKKAVNVVSKIPSTAAKIPVQEYAKMVKEQQAKASATAAAKTVEAPKEGGAGVAGARPWTAEEQTLLENAMRAVDKSVEDRWDQIAARVPGRTRKEVIARVKDLKQKLAVSPKE
mmetsp:Transcript_39486/g.77336  ORF Transcript_39486/g.77336 Transcript_39486/m.77336 type:complete len:122 (-) Transcript_39486:286-651(-)